MSSNGWSALIGAGGLLVNAIVLIFLLSQVKLLREQITHAKDAFVIEQGRVQREATLEFIGTTMERLSALNDVVPVASNAEATQEFIIQARTTPHVEKVLWDYLNYHESLAAGVNCGMFDIEVVERVRGTTIIRMEEQYREFIAEVRFKDNHPQMYVEIEILANALRERRRLRNTIPNNKTAGPMQTETMSLFQPDLGTKITN